MDQSKHSHPQEQFAFYRQKPEGDIDPAGEAGWYLQRERERRGMSLEVAGEACGIHPHHLEGIEHGDLTQLPPRSEALRMVGIYAQFLQFDPQPLVLHYAQFLPQPMPMAKRGKPRRPHPLTSAKIIKFNSIDKLKSAASGAGGIVASVLAAIVVYQGMVFGLSPDGPESGPLTAVPSITAPAVDAKSESMTLQSSDGEIVASINKVTESVLQDSLEHKIKQLAREADQSAGGLSGLTELLERSTGEIQIPLPKAKPSRADESTAAHAELAKVPPLPSASQTRVPGKDSNEENADARLVLKAHAAVWIRIEDRQGNVVMTRTLRKGDIYRVPNRDGLIVIARDGGLISYSIDGVDKGPLGNRGEILVGRPLDLSFLANKKS